ncbi:MAG: MFS transporter [Cellulomonas sp.]
MTSTHTAPDPDLTPPSPRDRRARIAVAFAFAAQGLVYAGLLSSLPGFKDRFGIGDDAVTFAILGVGILAAVGTVIAERVARGAGGSRSVLVSGLVTVAIAVVIIALAPHISFFFLGFAVYGLGLGQVDAGTNMQAVSLQRAYGRSIVTGFYAAWSAAGVVGALYVSAYAHYGIAQQVALPVLALAALAVAVVVLRSAWRSHDAPYEVSAEDARAARALPWSGILILGAAVVAYYVVDTASSTWGTLYLTDVLDAGHDIAPFGYAAYVGTTLVSRLTGDFAVRRWGRVAVIRAAGILGTVGLLAIVLAHSSVLAIAGFALTGIGLGVVAPLCFAAAGALSPAHANAVIARLNSFNYVGAILGGVLVGAIASGSTLRFGFIVPLVLAAVIILLAPGFAVGQSHGPATEVLDEPADAASHAGTVE